MSTRIQIAAACVLFTFCFVAVAPAASIGTETFDLGTNGWVGNTTSSVVVHVPNGGNPGGHIQAR